MSCGLSCARILLIVFNIIFWLSGGAILAIGIWMIVDSDIVEKLEFIEVDSDDEMLKYAAYLLIALGAFVLVVGFCGCCGAIRKSKCLLGIYIFLLVLVMAGELAAGILAVVYRDDIVDRLEDELKEELRENELIKEDGKEFSTWGAGLSLVQQEWSCCGISGWKDYRNREQKIGGNASEWGWSVLPTCCIVDKDGADSEDLREAPHVEDIDSYFENTTINNCIKANLVAATELENGYNEGCKVELEDWFESKAYILIGVGIGIACLELFGILFTICLCRAIGEDD